MFYLQKEDVTEWNTAMKGDEVTDRLCRPHNSMKMITKYDGKEV